MSFIRKISISENKVIISEDQNQVFHPSTENAIIEWVIWTDDSAQFDILPFNDLNKSSEVCEIEKINNNTLCIDVVYSDLCFDVTGNKIEKIERPYNREELIDMILKLNECRQNESKQKFEYKNQIDSVLNYIEYELHKCQIILDNKSDSEISSKKAKAKKECLKIAKSKLLK